MPNADNPYRLDPQQQYDRDPDTGILVPVNALLAGDGKAGDGEAEAGREPGIMLNPAMVWRKQLTALLESNTPRLAKAKQQAEQAAKRQNWDQLRRIAGEAQRRRADTESRARREDDQVRKGNEVSSPLAGLPSFRKGPGAFFAHVASSGWKFGQVEPGPDSLFDCLRQLFPGQLKALGVAAREERNWLAAQLESDLKRHQEDPGPKIRPSAGQAAAPGGAPALPGCG